jgi:hypothetical protein
VFAALDVDNTGTVDSQEFIAGVLNTLNPGITSVIIEASFRRMDRWVWDGEGAWCGCPCGVWGDWEGPKVYRMSCWYTVSRRTSL